ncbi:MAG: hypothetical protein ACREOO_07650 [bacterium]
MLSAHLHGSANKSGNNEAKRGNHCYDSRWPFSFSALFCDDLQAARKTEYETGEQLAKAREVEQHRKAKGNTMKSPMPGGQYNFWRGEQSLIKPVKNDLDAVLGDTCHNFANSNARVRAQMRAAMSRDEFYTLLTFSSRAAVFAIRERNVEWAVNGLTAIAMIAADRADARDIVAALVLHFHAAKRIGQDFDQLARDAAALAEAKVSQLIAELIDGSPEERDLSASIFDDVTTAEGAGFVHRDFEDYNPSCDLKEIAVEISDFITTDKYQAEFMRVAVELPRVWFTAQASEDNTPLDQALARVQGVVCISARLRPEAHSEYKNQSFIVFLGEAADASVAQLLLDISKKNKDSNHNMMGLAEGQLFCFVVARACVGEARPFETSESLTRFSEGISAILSRYAATLRISA